jgi:hypothetical protein
VIRIYGDTANGACLSVRLAAMGVRRWLRHLCEDQGAEIHACGKIAKDHLIAADGAPNPLWRVTGARRCDLPS